MKSDKESMKVPTSVQDTIPVKRVWPDGTFQTGSKFSKTFKFSDINYSVASRDDQMAMFLDYCELLNSLEVGATTKITINNRRLNKTSFRQNLLKSGIYCGQNAISKNMIFVNRADLLNGNSFILGVSGAGKSFFAKREILALVLKGDCDVIIIDPEREYTPLVQGLGGEVIHISAESPNHINAMDMVSDYADAENPIVLKSEFVLSLCEQLVGAGKLTAKEKSLIDRCTALVYRPYVMNGCKGTPPTLKDFHRELLMQPEPEAKDIALAIELFTEGSLDTFAKQTNVNTDSSLICYDIRDLGKALKTVGMLVVMDSIYNRIVSNKKKGRPTFVFIDEIYLLFANEYSSNFLFEQWKRARKHNAFYTGISQNIEDLLQSHTARTMLANSEFITMLNQAATDRIELAKLLGISDTQLSYVTNADAGKGLLKCAGSIVPFEDKYPTDTKLYKLMTTKPKDLLA